mgnify:CR=1 FL=1
MSLIDINEVCTKCGSDGLSEDGKCLDCGFDADWKVCYKNEVCPVCDGNGTHCNKNIDGNGLTQEDFEDDPDFRESYFRGDYDVTCCECNGRNVVKVMDHDAMSQDASDWFMREDEAQRECDAIYAAERRMGA